MNLLHSIAVYKAIYPSLGTLTDLVAAIDQVTTHLHSLVLNLIISSKLNYFNSFELITMLTGFKLLFAPPISKLLSLLPKLILAMKKELENISLTTNK